MKKFLAVFLALVLTLGLSATAFAADVDQESVVIHKVYKLEGAGSSPAETFTLQQVGDGVVKDGDAKAFPKGAASVDGTTGDIVVQLPVYERVGIYEYTLAEVAGTTAGVTYYTSQIRLVVTVINGDNGKLRIAAVHTESVDEAKSDNFPNTYSAGTLKLTKTVAGNLGDKSKYFEFKVTLTGEAGKTYAESFAVTGGSNPANPAVIKIGEVTTFLLKHDETLSIANLPYGVSYAVTETPVEGYTTEHTGADGVVGSAEHTVAFTNTKGGTVDTGITLDSLPYLIAIAVVVTGAVILFVRKRRSSED